MPATSASPIDSSVFFMLVLSRLVSNRLQLPVRGKELCIGLLKDSMNRIVGNIFVGPEVHADNESFRDNP
jgi:hypothetical protein